MTSKEAVLELICEAKSANIDEERVCFLRKIIEEDLDLLSRLVVENGLLKKDLIDYQEYIKKGVEEHYKDFMSNYDLLLQENHELNKKLEMLEILKKHYDKDSLTLSVGCFIHFYIYYKDTDFNKVKEWLENETIL